MPATRTRRRSPSPPWFAAYERALRQRGVPLVYLLVSWRDAQQLTRGIVPVALQRQAARLMEGPRA